VIGMMITRHMSYMARGRVCHQEATHKSCRRKAVIGDEDHLSHTLFGTNPCVPSRATCRTCKHKTVIGGMMIIHV
jgi:hypothetical protein